MNRNEWLGCAVAAGVIYAAFAIGGPCDCQHHFSGSCPRCRRGSRDAPPNNACTRLARLHRALGNEQEAKAFDDLAEIADGYILDECVVQASDLLRENKGLARQVRRARSA